MPVIIENKVEPIIINDKEVTKYEVLIVYENAHEKPVVDNHEVKVRKVNDKDVQKVMTLLT